MDGVGRQLFRNPFAGKAGLVLLLRWGLAGQFERVVPEDYVMGPCVACTCGEFLALDVGEIAECAGGCSRWFLRTEASVRVARWPVDLESDADADARIAREAMGRDGANG